MKKKTIIIISTIILAFTCAAVIFAYNVNMMKEKKQYNINKASSVLQPIYNTLLWAKECDDNDIKYNNKNIEIIQGYYSKILKKADVMDSLLFSNLSLIIGINNMLDIENEKYSNLVNSYIDQETGLYKQLTFENHDDMFETELQNTFFANKN